MRIFHHLKKLIKAADFFYSTEMLRYEDDLQYKTLTGGLVSLGMIITITIGFASMILDTLALNSFTITTEHVKNSIPTSSTIQINQQSPFRFALQIWRHNLTDTKRYFDITFRVDYQNYGIYNSTTYFPLQPCTMEYFRKYPEITNNFQTLESGGWLCPSLNMSLQLQGKYTSAHFNQYVIQASACKNQTDPSRPCASPQEIEKYFQQKLNFFYFAIYFTNSKINPDKKDYKHYYIQDQSYALFGSSIGSEVFLEFTDYTVETDQSIWPFSNIVTDSGCFAQNTGINRSFQTNINGTYVSLSLTKSSNSIYYYRQVQKLSMIFSFMGGMIGAISALLFIIKVYTNVAFQFSIAFQIFTPKDLKNQHPLKTQKVMQLIDENAEQKIKIKKKSSQMSINFYTFIRFYAYQFIDFFGFNLTTPQMKYAQQCKEEILKQLDVKKLLKRIIFIEHCLTKILDDYHLDVLQLKKPETPQEIREIRLKCQSIVDQQLQEEQKVANQKSSSSSMKEVDSINQQLPQSPYDVNINQQHFQRSPTRLNQIRLNYFQFKRDQPQINVKKEIMVLNMDEIKEDKNEQEATSTNFNKTSKNLKAGDLFKKKRKRQSNLVQLLSTAQEGNEISNSLWKKLDKQTKSRAFCHSKLKFEL